MKNLSILSIIFVLASCGQTGPVGVITEENKTVEVNTQEQGSLLFALPPEDVFSEKPAYLRFQITPEEGEGVINQLVAYAAGKPVHFENLKVGNYKLSVTSLNEENGTIDEGTSTVSIEAGKNAEVAINLEEVGQDDTGSLTVIIKKKESDSTPGNPGKPGFDPKCIAEPSAEPMMCGMGGPEMCLMSADGRVIERVQSLSTCKTAELRCRGFVTCDDGFATLPAPVGSEPGSKTDPTGSEPGAEPAPVTAVPDRPVENSNGSAKVEKK